MSLPPDWKNPRTPASESEVVFGAEIPVYISHKEVRALKIASTQFVGPFGDCDDPKDATTVILHFEEGPAFSRQVKTANRPTPAKGWYYIIYPDGYHSFSPAKAFEEGYTRKP